MRRCGNTLCGLFFVSTHTSHLDQLEVRVALRSAQDPTAPGELPLAVAGESRAVRFTLERPGPGTTRGTRSVGIVLGQFAIVLGFTSTVPILEYYTAVH